MGTGRRKRLTHVLQNDAVHRHHILERSSVWGSGAYYRKPKATMFDIDDSPRFAYTFGPGIRIQGFELCPCS